ncbi:hypothetical protein CVV73_25275, partial [Enterobacter hormaechei]
LNGAVSQLYQEMSARHRVRYPCIHIIKTATVAPKDCKRANTQQFHDSKIKFPKTFNLIRPSAPERKSIYKAKRPAVCMI